MKKHFFYFCILVTGIQACNKDYFEWNLPRPAKLPNNTCNVTQETISNYPNTTLETTMQEYFNMGDDYQITIISGSGYRQVDNVSLYDNDIFIFSWGNYLLLDQICLLGACTAYSGVFTLPDRISISNCYNVRITHREDLFVSPTFTVVSN
jgi:hypothetical protein